MDRPGVATWEAARALRDQLAEEGKRLVFTNGCFDVLHVGHVRYLNEAKERGDALCVAINADASVRALKGPHRPVNDLEDRAEVLLGLHAVDIVVAFSEERATGAIRAIAPHVYVKGGDYTPMSLNIEERTALDEVGAEIRILQLVPGKSTTETLKALGQEEQGVRRQKLRLGVLGLFAAIEDGRLPETEIAVVLSDVADARLLSLARERGIDGIEVDPGPFRTRLSDAAQKEICDRLRAASIDLVILAGFMRRLKAPILDAFSDRVLNVHPSLLPKFPGRAAWDQALGAGASETGTTVHLVDSGIDSGRILGQRVVPILAGDTAELLQARIQTTERRLYPKVIAEYARMLGIIEFQSLSPE